MSLAVQGAKHCGYGLALTCGCCETRNRTQVAVWPLVSKPAMKMAPTSGSSRSSARGLPAGIVQVLGFQDAFRPMSLWAADGHALEVMMPCKADYDQVWSRRCRPAGSQDVASTQSRLGCLLIAGAG